VDLASKKLEHGDQIALKLFPGHDKFVLAQVITVTMGLIEFLRAMEQRMVRLFNQNFGPCTNWLLMFENRLEVQNELIWKVSEEFRWSQERLIERFDTIIMALDVDAMEIDSVSKPINFVALTQAAVNEGFAQIALDTKVTENARSRQAVALLQAKKKYRKRAKATRNLSRQTSRSVLPMPSSLGFREYIVDSAVVDRVATLELQWSRLNAPLPLTKRKGKLQYVQDVVDKPLNNFRQTLISKR
jgi:hypothetical protein